MKNSNLYNENNNIWPISDQDNGDDESEFESAYENQTDDETIFDERKPKPKQHVTARLLKEFSETGLDDKTKIFKKLKRLKKISRLTWSNNDKTDY